MGFLIKGGGGGEDFKPIDAGSHIARCYAFIDLGTQRVEHSGQVKTMRKVRLCFEVPAERRDDGKPMVIAKKYTASLHEKSTLSQDLTSWRGKGFTQAERAGGFEMEKIVGQPLSLSVVHEEKRDKSGVYAAIKGLSALPKGVTCPPLESEPVFFNLDEFDPAVFAKLTERTQKEIMQSPEYAAATGRGEYAGAPSAGLGDMDDDIPF